MSKNVADKRGKTGGAPPLHDLTPQGPPLVAPDSISLETIERFAPVLEEPPRYYQVPVEFNRQEDGLWRAEAPHLEGCWVDAPTLEEALSQIQEVLAMVLDLYEERGREVPTQVTRPGTLPLKAAIPVALGETTFRRVEKDRARRKPAR
jgi:predicted RNase H-like HicB family nuclease